MKSGRFAVAFAVACLGLALPACAQQAAERIWSGGPMLTINDNAMRADAVAESGDRIVAVGSQAQACARQLFLSNYRDSRP